jgi:hypothetical protein
MLTRLLLRRHLSQALPTLVGSLRTSGVGVPEEVTDVISCTYNARRQDGKVQNAEEIESNEDE